MAQKRILVVEDEGIVAADIQRTLENLGYLVISSVVSGEEALENAAFYHPDLVLMDIQLKGQMNGIEAARELMQRFNIPVVYLTSYADDVTLENVIKTGPFGYILKPYGVRDLHSSIEIALYKHRLDRSQKTNETILRRIIEKANTGILVSAQDQVILISNPAFQRITGFNGNDLEKQPLSRFIHPDALEEYHQATQAFWARDTHCVELVTRLQHQDKRTVWIEFSANLLDIEEEIPGYAVIIIEDISARVEAEEAYHKLIDQSPLGIIIIQDEKIIFANPSICKMSGYSCQELIELTPQQTQELIHPEDRQSVVERHRLRMQGTEAANVYEYRMIRKDQSIRWMSITIGPTIYQGKPAVLAYYADIQKQKELEIMLRRGKDEWEATVDAVSDILILTDIHDVVIRCNRAAAHRFENNFHHIIGKNLNEILPTTMQKAGQLLNLAGKHFIEDLNGWFYTSSFPLELNHTLNGRVYLLKDITHEKEIEAALFANQRLTSLGTLAAGLAHEMNSPLQVITSISESLLRQIEKGNPIDTERLYHYMQMVNRNAWRNADIVRALRLYASSPNAKIEEVDLNQIIRDTLPLLEKRHNQERQIDIHTHLEDELPLLFCSRENLSVVLVNLITNAIESMPNGGQVTIQTHYQAEREHIVLQIRDSGSGIAPEIQSKIFDPFFTTKPVGSGPGLGLSTTLGIIKSCGGEIGLESDPESGSTFTIYLPIHPMKESEKNNDGNGRYQL